MSYVLLLQQVGQRVDARRVMGDQDLIDEFEPHLQALKGRRLKFPGPNGPFFEVTDVAGDQVRVVGAGAPVMIPKTWVTSAWSVLVRRKTLVRSGISPTTAQYRSGYIFAILQTHPRTRTAAAFPTKLVIEPE
jgi:hypothetical protein